MCHTFPVLLYVLIRLELRASGQFPCCQDLIFSRNKISVFFREGPITLTRKNASMRVTLSPMLTLCIIIFVLLFLIILPNFKRSPWYLRIFLKSKIALNQVHLVWRPPFWYNYCILDHGFIVPNRVFSHERLGKKNPSRTPSFAIFRKCSSLKSLIELKTIFATLVLHLLLTLLHMFKNK